MANYYDEILEDVQKLLANNDWEEALFVLKKELEMPYIPKDIEEKLKYLQKEALYQKSQTYEPKEESLESILNHLKGSEKQQLAAAVALTGRNLRECIAEIQAWLEDNPCPEAAALVIEALGEQQINEEFVLAKNGIEYTFFGDDIVPIEMNSAVHLAIGFLNEWLSNDNPDFFEMAKTLLIHEAYLFLPLSYEDDEAKDFALSVLDQVSTLMDDGVTANKIRRKLGIPLVLRS